MANYMKMFSVIVLTYLCSLNVKCNAYEPRGGIDFLKTRTCIQKTTEFQVCLKKYHDKIQDQQNNKDDNNKVICCAYWKLIEVLSLLLVYCNYVMIKPYSMCTNSV